MKLPFLVLTCLLTFSSLFGQRQSSAQTYFYSCFELYAPIEKELLKFSFSLNQEIGASIDNQHRVELKIRFSKAITQAQNSSNYNGDSSLLVGIKQWLNTGYEIVSVDFVELEKRRIIANKSSAHMQAFFEEKQLISNKYVAAVHKLDSATHLFADKHRLEVIEVRTKRGQKLTAIQQAIAYYDSVYLPVFEVFLKNDLFNQAINGMNDVAVKNARLKLKETADSSRLKIDKIGSYKGRDALKQSADSLIASFNLMAEQYGSLAERFYRLSDKYKSTKKQILAKSAEERTNEEILEYNNLVKQYNLRAKEFELSTASFNEFRKENMANWNAAVEEFVDQYLR